MYGYYYGTGYLFYTVFLLVISMCAHFKVRHAFNKYSKINSNKGISGVQSAQFVLRQNNVSGVTIGKTSGYFTDYFDSRTNTILLSDKVYSPSTIASISVAAHEAGHAVQNAHGYLPLKIRQFLVPITQIGSNIALPLVFIGLLLPVQYSFIVNFGIMLFAFVVLFQFITLPVEFNASRRALQSLKETGMVSADEEKSVKSVLDAAAYTYVAATFTAVLTLLRLIFVARRKN